VGVLLASFVCSSSLTSATCPVQVDDDDKSDVDDEEMDSGTKAPETDGQQSSKEGGDKQSKSVRVLVAAEGKCVCTPSQSLLNVGPLGVLELSAPHHHSSRRGSAMGGAQQHPASCACYS
jgi:hypothetical protein